MAASTIASLANDLKAHYKFSSFRDFEKEFQAYKIREAEMAKRKTTEQKMEDASGLIDKMIESLSNAKWVIRHFDGDPVDKEVITSHIESARDGFRQLHSMRFKN